MLRIFIVKLLSAIALQNNIKITQIYFICVYCLLSGFFTYRRVV